MLEYLRNLQLASANLPVGGFTYSQGLEWAVEAKWVTNQIETKDWLIQQMYSTLRFCDLPILARLYQCTIDQDEQGFSYWIKNLLRQRETSELRLEEQQRGKAFFRFLQGLGGIYPWQNLLMQSQLAGFAWYGATSKISLEDLQISWSYSWLESNIMAAIKLVPLGQQAGQQLIYQLSTLLPSIITQANAIEDNDIGAGSPLVAIASSCHENQYSRLFRS